MPLYIFPVIGTWNKYPINKNISFLWI